MKRTLFIAILIGNLTFGQNCKYKTNTIDEFTNDKILETKDEFFTISGMGLGFSTSYSLKKINEKRYLRLGILNPSIFTLREGDEVVFKTMTDTPISLKFPQTIIANGQYNSASKSTYWITYSLILISDEVYNRLQNEKIIKLRVYTGDGFVDDNVKEKRAVKFQELLKCI
jgi:hypothetical protein